jgi:hypothetical protein
MATWDESKKFWAETVRTVLLASAGAVAAVLIIKPWESDVDFTGELRKTQLTIRAQVVDDYLAASYRYTAVAYDACHAYGAKRRTAADKTTIAIFEGDAVDGLRSARRRLEIYFSGLEPLKEQLAHADTLGSRLFESCSGGGANEAAWEATRQELKSAHDKAAVTALEALHLTK